MALVHVMLSLTDSEPNAPWPAVQPEGARRRSASRPGTLLRPARSRLKATGGTAVQVVQEGVDLLMHPSHLLKMGHVGRNTAVELGRFLLLEPDPTTILRGELGVSKRAAWSAGIPLEDIRAIRRALGGTINDVLLTLVTGALRRYLQDRGEPVDNFSMRVTVPVNVRPPGREADLGNRVGALFVTLPVSIGDPVCRLGEIVRRMNGRKDSLEAPLFYGALLKSTPSSRRGVFQPKLYAGKTRRSGWQFSHSCDIIALILVASPGQGLCRKASCFAVCEVVPCKSKS